MGKPPICPYCQSPNRMNVLRCRVCGERLRGDEKQRNRSPPKPVVLERVMTGEVFTAVLGKAGSKREDKEENAAPTASRTRISIKGEDRRLRPYEDRLSQADDLAARADAAMELGIFERAIEYLDEVLDISPRDPKALYKKGFCLGRQGKHDEAITWFEKALEENPEDAQLWHMKCESERETESYQDALFSADRAIQISPDFANAWFSKGSVLQLLGKLVEAYVSFLEVLRLDPNHTGALTLRNETEDTLASRGLHSLIVGKASWNDLPRSMQYDPQSGPRMSKAPLVSLAEDAQSENRFDESLYFYDQALSGNEDDSFLWQEKGEILSKMGRFTQAVGCFERSTALASGSRRVPSARGTYPGHHLAPPAQSPRQEAMEVKESMGEPTRLPGTKKTPPFVGNVPDDKAKSEVKEQTACSSTVQLEETQERAIGAEDVERLEKRISDIVTPKQESDQAEEQTEDESFFTSKLKMRLGREREIQKTYVRGLDVALGGGIPSRHVVLIAGAPGTMKSSLAFFILYSHALEERKTGLYVTLEQSTTSLIGQMESLGMEYDGVRESLRILDMAHLKSRHSMTKEKWMKVLYSQIKKLKRRFDLSFLVIDSLDALMAIGGFNRKRQKAFMLFGWLRELGVTTFVVAERPDFVVGGNVIQSKSVEDFLADGVLLLRLHLVDDVNVQRRIRCLKMREMRHNNAYMALAWDDGYFNVTKVVR